MSGAVTAVWFCGSPACGKSRIGEQAVLPLGFELIDTDAVYEDLAQRYRLGLEIVPPSAAEKRRFQVLAAARRTARSVVEESAAEGRIVLGRLVERLERSAGEGRLERQYCSDLVARIHERLGSGTVTAESFHLSIWPRMADLGDPLDYLEEPEEVTQERLRVVAREIARRRLIEARAGRRDLLLIETGGQTGRLLNLKTDLEAEGYGTFLVWVFVASLETALRRNRQRGDRGGRCLSDEIVERSFAIARRSRERLLPAFAGASLEIDNSRDGERHLGERVRQVRSAVAGWMDVSDR